MSAKSFPCTECGQLIFYEHETLAQMKRRYIQQVLQEQGYNQARASRVLGINRSTLCRYLKKERCQRHQERKSE